MTKSYKMVVLRVLLDEGMLFWGIDLSRLCIACRRYLQNHEVLRRDLEGEHHAVDHQNADQTEWANWWIKWPVSRWLDVQSGKRWFTRDGDRFRLNIDCPERLKPSLDALTEEIVDWRLAAYSKSHRLDEVASGELAFEGKVSHAQGRPILFLPDRARMPDFQDGGRYTVKRYHSTKTASDDGWQHETIELQPLNPDFPPIQLTAQDAENLRVIGKFVAVIEQEAAPGQRDRAHTDEE